MNSNATKNSQIPPIAFSGGLYKIHFPFCLKITDVHAKEVNQFKT